MSDKRYAIWVSVSGGVTGTRAAFLKDHDGKPQVFNTILEATNMAESYIMEMNSPYSQATFSAKVLELSHE